MGHQRHRRNKKPKPTNKAKPSRTLRLDTYTFPPEVEVVVGLSVVGGPPPGSPSSSRQAVTAARQFSTQAMSTSDIRAPGYFDMQKEKESVLKLTVLQSMLASPPPNPQWY